LFEHYVDLVEKLAPRAFVMENVKGLLTMLVDREDLSKAEAREVAKLRLKQDALPDKYTRNSRLSRETLEAGRAERARLKRLIQPFQEAVPGVIKRRFESLGYHTEMQVLNSADFGVPQRRERVVFIGLRSGKPAFPAPTHAESTNGDLFAALAPWRTVREAIDDLAEAPEDELRHHIRTTHSGTFLAKIKKTPVGRSVFESYSDAFFRLQPDQPSRTVKENHNSVFVHYSQPRVMTPRELARLQDFSDDYLFFGTKASVLKQIGNAVPVGLGTALGRSLKAMLSGGECAKESRAKKGPARKASAA
jgi:site-specific DNA-cytosine methylase